MATSSQQSFQKYLLSAALISIINLIYLLLIPGDPKNSLLLGFSLLRLLMAGGLLLITTLLVLCFFWSRSSPGWINRFHHLALSLPAAIMVTLITLAAMAATIWTLPGVSTFNQAVAARLRPYFLTAFLLSVLTLWYQINYGKDRIQPSLHTCSTRLKQWSQILLQMILKLDIIFNKPFLNILLILAASSPILLKNAFEHDLPIGYAGLYALMSEKIAANLFALPIQIPFYGPGGIPFAYPPLAFYLMGAITQLPGATPMLYLRFAAPIFCLLALIPMYLLTKRLTGSAYIGTGAAILLAASPRIFLVHGLSAGLARGLAFFFALFGLYFFTAPSRNQSAVLQSLPARSLDSLS